MKNETSLYPIIFQPILKEKVWGGTKLQSTFNKSGKGLIGESWEISGVPDNISIVANGELKGKSLNWLIEKYGADLVGKDVYEKFGNTFPLLFKFIDAREDLSVQLHPDDTLAKARHNSFGKTEMWYILDVEKDSRIILGFNQDMTEEVYQKSLSENNITKILHSEYVQKGDAYIITPGLVHAIGAGVMLAEIQQTSDVTYRIYDWDRPDTNGEMRELHNDLALDAIDYNIIDAKVKYKAEKNEPTPMGSTQFFATNKLEITKTIVRNLNEMDSCKVYMCTKGEALIESEGFSEKIKMGETILIPAILSQIKITSNSATFLEVYIP